MIYVKKRAFTVLFLAALLLSACGGGKTGETMTAAPQEESGDWYGAETHSLDCEGVIPNDLCLSGDRVWCSGEKHKENTILTWKSDGSDFHDLGPWTPCEELLQSLPEDRSNVHIGVHTLLRGPEGSLMGVASISYDVPDPDNPIWFTDGSARPGSKWEVRSFVICMDEKLQTRFWYRLEDYEPYLRPSADLDGMFCFVDGKELLVFDTEGNQILRLPVPGQCAGLTRLADGRVALELYVDNGLSIRPVDLITGTLQNGPTVRDFGASVFPGAFGWDLLVNTGSVLYGVNLDGTQGPVLTWLNVDLDGNRLIDVAADPKGESAFVLFSPVRSTGSSGEHSVACITKSDHPPAQERIVLKLACMGLDSKVAQLVLHFNRTDPEYRIEVTDYSVYNTSSAPDAGFTILHAEIATGHVPDLFAASNLSIRTYGDRGLLEDLWPWIDADEALGGRDALMTPVFEAIAQGGPLYQISPSFGINTLVGPKEIVGDRMGWSLEDFYEAARKMPEGAWLFPRWFARKNILTISMCMRLDDFVDRNKAECRFDSKEFRELVRFTETFPAEMGQMDPSDERTDYERVIQRDQMLLNEFIDSFDAVKAIQDFLGEQVAFVGFPGASGNGSAFEIDAGLAMGACCEHKEGAWRFLRLMLDADMQIRISDNGFYVPLPTNRAAFEKLLAKEMEVEYELNADGSYLLDKDGNRIPKPRGGRPLGGNINGTGPIVFIYPMTREQADQFLELINTTTCVRYWDDSVMDVVTEEIGAYYAGDRTLDQACANIQKRVTIYLQESK